MIEEAGILCDAAQRRALSILDNINKYGHEQLVAHTDPSSGLKSFIAIHDTALGPSCGGCRIWPYSTEADAIEDVLLLSRAMTYKSAMAGLSLGGGKAVIIADAQSQKTEFLMKAFGRFVDTLEGRYITTEDVGCTPEDMEYVSTETKHVVGLPKSVGGSGETSVMTALGVYLGMKACGKAKWGSASLTNRVVAMQGFGSVGRKLAAHILNEGAQLIVTDVYQAAMEQAQRLGAVVVGCEEIYDVECDIFSPNALGGTLNNATIPRLRCDIVAGAANNQLSDQEDSVALARRGIIYAPDYVINAGGIINVSFEIGQTYDEDRARQKTEGISDTIEQVLQLATKEDISTSRAADSLAESRIKAAQSQRRNNLAG